MNKMTRSGMASQQMNGRSVSASAGLAFLVAYFAFPVEAQGLAVSALTPVFSFLLPSKMPWKKV